MEETTFGRPNHSRTVATALTTKLTRHDIRVSVPLYTLAEAARYLDVAPSTLHGWARPQGSVPWITVLPPHGHAAALPFVGFAEAFVIKAALDAGVPNHRIRPGIERIKERAGGMEHALASRVVYTDGAELLLEVVDDEDLDVARTNQRAFRKTVDSALKLITFGGDYAERIQLPKFQQARVVVDPWVASGKPVVDSGVGPRIKDVIDRVHGGDDPATVAREFKISVPEIEAVIRGA